MRQSTQVEAEHDPLTGLYNRGGGVMLIRRCVERHESGAFLIIDIDDFKMVNDTYGHVCGDYILTSIAQITTETMNDEFVCRYGGEEFIIILKNEKKNQVFQRLETLRKNIENYAFEFEDKKIHITITLGAAKYTKNINSLASWIEVADAKLYDGKQTGKNKTIL